MIVKWEVPNDLGTLDLSRADMGSDSDISLGISEVTDIDEVIFYNSIEDIISRIPSTSVTKITPDCIITGSVIHPWGSSLADHRIDLYSDNLQENISIFTNSVGKFTIPGMTGQRMKIKFAKDNFMYWVAVPDKTTITFDELVKNGYVISI